LNEAAIDIAQTPDVDAAVRSVESALAANADYLAPYVATDVLHAINPATREPIADVFATPATRIPALVANARGAARTWGSRPFAQRAEVLIRLRKLVAQQALEIAETISRSMGKPLLEALTFEVAPVIETLDACIEHANDALADEPSAAIVTLPVLLGRYKAALQPCSPCAVVCVIAPVSAPFERAMTPAAIALAAGNAVIVKPASSAPLVGMLIERLFDEAFAALPGLVQVAHGSRALGVLVATAAGVDTVIFTGSARSGSELQAALVLLQRPARLDFGSVAPAIVCDDANLERAANAVVFGRFSNSGQTCASVKRVYVQRAVADAFIHKVVHKVRALKSGPYTDPFCELGPLANGDSLQHLREVLQESLQQRAQQVAGGFPPHVTGPDNGERRGAERQGWYWPPTVITHVDHAMRIMKEAVFGPILPIQLFEDDSQAVALANDTQFAFDACVFCADAARAAQIAAGLHAQVVAVNDLFPQVAASGLRAMRTGAEHAPDSEPHWFPYSVAKLHASERALARLTEA
jgi:acyl-CoA reductase-like NAD-dependent aldehyde dehydrogenase